MYTMGDNTGAGWEQSGTASVEGVTSSDTISEQQPHTLKHNPFHNSTRFLHFHCIVQSLFCF